MRCPFCFTEETKVIDSRLVSDGYQVRRRRECGHCHERFTTFETAELIVPKIIKTDGTREPFNEDKLRSGIQHALEKRPVSADDVEQAINHIIFQYFQFVQILRFAPICVTNMDLLERRDCCLRPVPEVL